MNLLTILLTICPENTKCSIHVPANDALLLLGDTALTRTIRNPQSAIGSLLLHIGVIATRSSPPEAERPRCDLQHDYQ